MHCVDPFDRDSVYGASLYWRLHGRGGYRYEYTGQELAQMVSKLHSSLAPDLRYVMFNNITSKQDAIRFLQLWSLDERHLHPL